MYTIKTKLNLESAKELAKTLEGNGFKRWQKNNSNRLYVNEGGWKRMGFEISRYKSGNISSSSYKGEPISHGEMGRILDSKSFIDLNTGEAVSLNKSAVEYLVDFIGGCNNENL